MTFGLLKKDLREKRKGEKKFGGVFKFIVDINYNGELQCILLTHAKKIEEVTTDKGYKEVVIYW